MCATDLLLLETQHHSLEQVEEAKGNALPRLTRKFTSNLCDS